MEDRQAVATGHRAVEGLMSVERPECHRMEKVCRGDSWQWRGQKALEGAEGHRGPQRWQRDVEGT